MKENCQQIEPLLPAYALGALDRADFESVEQHLEGCSKCQADLTQYQAMADDLLLATPPIEPPQKLRETLANSLPAAAHEKKPQHTARRRRRLISGLAYAAAVVVLVAANLIQMNNVQELAAAQQKLDEQNRAFEAAIAMMASPETDFISIDQGSISGLFMFYAEGNQAVLNLQGLMPVLEQQSYQIWLIRPDQTRVSAGVFRIDKAGEDFIIEISSPEAFETYTGMGITVEPAGGSLGPTGPRVIGIEL
jgi:anti-sigma-K factor RskA